MAGSSWETGCQWDLGMPLANLYIATPARNVMDNLHFAPTKSYKPLLPDWDNDETVISSELRTEGFPVPLAEKWGHGCRLLCGFPIFVSFPPAVCGTPCSLQCPGGFGPTLELQGWQRSCTPHEPWRHNRNAGNMTMTGRATKYRTVQEFGSSW